MLSRSAGGGVEMGNKRHRDNFIKVNGIFEEFKKLIVVIIEFGNLEKYLPKKAVCMVSCKCNSFLVDG